MARRSFLAALLSLAACSTHKVSPETAKKMVSEGARLVDVRSEEEFASEHLEGAINIPVSDLDARLKELEPKEQAVVVYCAAGMRSARAANKLAEAGFKKVGDLGAMSNWPK